MSKFTIHNGIESNDVNSPVNITTGLEVGGLSFPSLSGTAWFVDAASTAGTGADGRTKDTAFSLIASAITAADDHDVIFVYPGTYNENLTVPATKDYLTLVGVQTGYGRPDVNPTTGVALTVLAQGFSCARMRFVTDVDTNAVVQRGNGFTYDDCVFDGSAQSGSSACLLLQGLASDDSYTASEGTIRNSLVRGSTAKGIAIKAGDPPTNGVGSTHCVFDNVRFIDNTAEDVIVLNNAGAAYGLQDCVFNRCSFMSKNKATHIDIQTNHGASNTGNVFTGCYIFDDTIDTTAVKAVGTGSGFIGCFSLDGVIDGDALD